MWCALWEDYVAPVPPMEKYHLTAYCIHSASGYKRFVAETGFFFCNKQVSFSYLHVFLTDMQNHSLVGVAVWINSFLPPSGYIEKD